MKKKQIFPIFVLATVLSAGALMGLASKKEMKAAYAAVLPSYNGSIAIELQDVGEGNYWDNDNAKLAAHIYNNSDAGEMGDLWTGLVQTTPGTHHYILPYTTSNYFDPFAGSNTVVDFYRFNPEVTNAADGYSQGKQWNSALNLTMGNVVYVYDWNVASMVRYYVGAESDSWRGSANFIFRNAKISGDTFEVYGDINLGENDEFKILVPLEKMYYYANYSTHSSLSEIIVGDQSNNINCTTAGTYSMFHNISTHNTYVTTPTLASADEWAEDFLGANCAATKSGWNGFAASYSSLSSSVKALFVGEEHVDKDAETPTYYQKAIQRYDYILELYGTSAYNDFMGRVEAGRVVPHATNGLLSPLHNNQSVLIISLVSGMIIISVTGLYFALRKRPQA